VADIEDVLRDPNVTLRSMEVYALFQMGQGLAANNLRSEATTTQSILGCFTGRKTVRLQLQTTL